MQTRRSSHVNSCVLCISLRCEFEPCCCLTLSIILFDSFWFWGAELDCPLNQFTTPDHVVVFQFLLSVSRAVKQSAVCDVINVYDVAQYHWSVRQSAVICTSLVKECVVSRSGRTLKLQHCFACDVWIIALRPTTVKFIRHLTSFMFKNTRVFA